MAALSTESAPWYIAYPEPRTPNPPIVSRAELLIWLQEGQLPGADFILVDLRRNDHEGGTIRGSINIPAQTMYDSIPTLYRMFSAAKIGKVIWYCGSSRGRGTRAAAWFSDYIEDQHGDVEMTSYTLLEGIAGWARGGKSFVDLMDGYDKECWQKR